MFYSKKLKKIKKINHCFFSKKNGFSTGIYSSLNCGPGSNDSGLKVKKNLNLVSKKMKIKNNNLILMNQIHSNKVIIINKKNIKSKKIKCDALITSLKGVALGVLTADCVPIILYDEINHVIGCVHAGWKGALSGIIKNTIYKFKELNSINKISASVGPCIGNKSYEVKIDFYQNFMKETMSNKRFFKKKENGKYLFNLRSYVNNKLKINGIRNIDNVDFDTFKDNGNFFSYRRSQKLGEVDYGRCISTICLKT